MAHAEVDKLLSTFGPSDITPEVVVEQLGALANLGASEAVAAHLLVAGKYLASLRSGAALCAVLQPVRVRDALLVEAKEREVKVR